ncbi:hypothetical protein ASE74_12505 [Pedobacter sp. Leaf216]|uniref:hypothetical protein n=1 Tax=Pedobacter sp. Leaf216 TaxID=1735684 RepID=UPI0006F4EDEF|nr:hypothetical protein [Pedobacter sp. Leaf216]KQM78780.1 hypothetical protein ASE74_12505 [Pedobacter sp. Leaf216]
MKWIKSFVFLLPLLAIASVSKAQQIKDGETVNLNGIAVTYSVVNKEKLTIKDQDFDRYKVLASVKNNTGKSLNIRLSNSMDLSGISSSKIVELDCINATGARLTSKKVQVSMKSHLINVTYPTRDKDGKTTTAILPVTAGYYLDEGQTIENDAIFIVPAGETPKVSVRSLLKN